MTEVQLATENEPEDLSMLTDRERDIVLSIRDKQSMEVLGKKYNVTRNVIAGWLYRARKKAGLKPDSPLRQWKNRKPPERKPKDNVIAFPGKMTISRAPEKSKRVRYRMITDENMVTFEELTADKCKWPFGDPRQPDFRFCGCPRTEGSPYCLSHTAIAYNDPKHRSSKGATTPPKRWYR
jgi:hypothetical protein